MNEKQASEFKEGYEKSKTWKDADELCQTLTARQHHELYEALKVVKAYMGLDMRQDFYMGILRHSRV